MSYIKPKKALNKKAHKHLHFQRVSHASRIPKLGNTPPKQQRQSVSKTKRCKAIYSTQSYRVEKVSPTSKDKI